MNRPYHYHAKAPKTKRTFTIAGLSLLACLLIVLGIFQAHHPYKIVFEPATTPTTQTSNLPEPPRPRYVSDSAALSSLETSKTIAEAETAMNAFLKPYRLKAIMTNAKPKTSFTSLSWLNLDEASLPLLKSYGAIFMDEFAKYPTSLITASHVREVVFVKRINNSHTGSSQFAQPAAYDNQIVYGIEALNSGQDYARGVLHHEFAHLLDYAFYGSYYHNNADWTALNPSGFHYKGSGEQAYTDPHYTGATFPEAGFVSDYARYAEEEDRAEVFAFLMVKSRYDLLKTKLSTDSHLSEKVRLYKAYLATHCPALSETYYDTVNR